MNVLIAEDDPVLQQMIAVLLSRRAISFRLVEDGKSAVNAWAEGNFDLILMDIQMSGLDGLEATRAIREKERFSGGHVTIIAMTAHALARDKEQCLAAGMDDYIAKPIEFDALFSLLNRYAPP